MTTDWVNSLAVLPDCTLASGSYPDILVWSVKTGQSIKTLTGHTNWVLSLAVLPDGTLARGSYQEI